MKGFFRAEVASDLDRMRSAFDEQAPTGDVDILVATFDEPDRSVPVGLNERQVIDRGAFRTWIEGTDFNRNTVPIFADHGEAYRDGVARATLKIGKAFSFAESSDGLVVRGSYNLSKAIGRDMYSDLIHDPTGVEFSFRWPPTEKVFRGEDGYEHVTEFERVDEVSQVGKGAGRTALLGARARAIEEWGWTEDEVRALITTDRFREAIVPLVAEDAELFAAIEAVVRAGRSQGDEAVAADALAAWERAVWEVRTREV